MDGFAHRTDPFSGEGAFHKGVDITAPTGTSVRATADGVVVQAEMVSGGYGRLIIVDHGGGIQTYYAHLSKISVHAGQEVRRSEVIGLVGTSGRTTAPHLHYEVRVGGAPHESLPLSGQCQRLPPGAERHPVPVGPATGGAFAVR